MHERSIAKNLLNIILEKTDKKNKLIKISRIRIIVGEFTMVHDELLISAFYQFSKCTQAERAVIEIIHSPLRGRCQECGEKFKLNKKEFKCPKCNSCNVQIISGDELFIQDIEISNDDSAKNNCVQR